MRGCYKKVPKAAMSPTTIDLHWAAGFIEGEAGFAKSKSQSGRIRVNQVYHNEPLLKLQKMLGGSVTPYLNRLGNPTWRWCVSGARARGVAMTLYCLLSKRRQKQAIKLFQ